MWQTTLQITCRLLTPLQTRWWQPYRLERGPGAYRQARMAARCMCPILDQTTSPLSAQLPIRLLKLLSSAPIPQPQAILLLPGRVAARSANYVLPSRLTHRLAGAVIVTSGASGNILSCAGTPSASPSVQQFTVSGAKLTANITATAPPGFEVSLTAGSGYGSSATLTQTAGTVNSTIIYVRSSATAIGHITGNIVLTSAGTTSQNVAVAATATPLPGVNPVSNQTVTKGAATTAVSFAGNASSFSWVNNTPSIGLAASGTGDIPSFTAANPGAGPLTASVTGYPRSIYQISLTLPMPRQTPFQSLTPLRAPQLPISRMTPSPAAVSVSPDGSKVYVVNSSSNQRLGNQYRH